MVCLAPGAGEKVSKYNLKTGLSEDLKMKNVGANIKRSMAKQQEAMVKFQTKRMEFLIAKEQITRDIDEARQIWKTTLEQMPNLPFS